MTETETELAELRAAFDDFTLRYSALEFIVEQMLANELMGQTNPEAFLDQLKQDDGRTWTQHQGIVERPHPDVTARLLAHLSAIVEKVRVRVRQGYRQT